MSFLNNVITGISLGSIYAIIALGYTMVYGIAKMLNFAHGDVIMVGGYIAFITFNTLGLNPLLAVLAAVVAVAYSFRARRYGKRNKESTAVPRARGRVNHVLKNNQAVTSMRSSHSLRQVSFWENTGRHKLHKEGMTETP